MRSTCALSAPVAAGRRSSVSAYSGVHKANKIALFDYFCKIFAAMIDCSIKG
jgi:hypothetical protein